MIIAIRERIKEAFEALKAVAEIMNPILTLCAPLLAIYFLMIFPTCGEQHIQKKENTCIEYCNTPLNSVPGRCIHYMERNGCFVKTELR